MNMPFWGGCLSIALFFSGCAVNHRIDNVMEAAQTDSDKVSALLKDASTARPVVKFYQEQWINPVPIKSVTKAIPEKMRRCHMTYKTSQPQTIYQFAQDVTQQCGFRVKISPDAAALLSRGASHLGGKGQTQNRDRGPSSLPPLDNDGMMPLPSMDIQTSRLNSATASMNNTITDVAFSGNVADLLDMVTARLGISWRCHHEEITLFYLETRRFNIDPTNAKYSLK
nr:PilN family type IVB pilus formation outer membrane protein [Candidatus Hamiltonella defensa]